MVPSATNPIIVITNICIAAGDTKTDSPENGLLYMFFVQKNDFDSIEVHFEDFKILSLRNCCKNDEKMPKNPKNHAFSILDKSADFADINDLQIT